MENYDAKKHEKPQIIICAKINPLKVQPERAFDAGVLKGLEPPNGFTFEAHN